MRRRGPRIRQDPGATTRSVEDLGRGVGDERSLFTAYLREVRCHRVLTRREEVALAKAIAGHAAALHAALLRIPWTARFVVARWGELRRAKRVTATLGALPPGQWDPDASARIDWTMGRVAALLHRRARLADRRDGRSQARTGIDTQIQELLLDAELSPSVLGEALDSLRERRAALARRGKGGPQRRPQADLAREIGLPTATFRERMREIEAHARALQEARNRFAEHNLKLVVKIAKEFSGMGLTLVDLIQEGNLGLLHAVDKFDHRRGFKFSTYGSWWIRQACIRAIQNQSRTIRLPSHVYDRALRAERVRAALSSRLGRAPETGEISAALRVNEEQVEDLRLAHQKLASLEDPLSSFDDRTVADVIAHPEDTDPVDAIDRDRIAGELGDLLPELPRREQQVLRWRFGLGGERPHTLEEIGHQLELSRERIRQIESAAIGKLRQKMAERHPVGAGELQRKLGIPGAEGGRVEHNRPNARD